MVYLGLEPKAAGWKALKNPQCYGSPTFINHFTAKRYYHLLYRFRRPLYNRLKSLNGVA